MALLIFFGLKSIKDAWELPPSSLVRNGSKNSELGELVEAEEIVKEEVIFFLQKNVERVLLNLNNFWKRLIIVQVCYNSVLNVFRCH